jgi:hypothetical protein
MKSRGAYETPGGTILYEAHKALEQICIERDTFHYKQQVALRYAELVYNGQWFHPLREALQAFIDHTQGAVTGQVKVKLFKGRATAAGVTSPHSLYDPQLASFSMEGYDVTAARGFIDLFGLPMKVAQQAKRVVIGPTVFIGALAVTQNPAFVQIALGVISNYVTDWFKGAVEGKKVRLSVVIEETNTRKCTRIECEGPPSGVESLVSLAKEIRSD